MTALLAVLIPTLWAAYFAGYWREMWLHAVLWAGAAGAALAATAGAGPASAGFGMACLLPELAIWGYSLGLLAEGRVHSASDRRVLWLWAGAVTGSALAYGPLVWEAAS